MNYDVVVIGSGPGGYVAAIRCAQLGFRTAVVERYGVLGGTCTNVGCIPSKALLDSSLHYYEARKGAEHHGFHIGQVELNFPAMMNRKAAVVKENLRGLNFLMKKNNIDIYHGHASFRSPHSLVVQAPEKNLELTATRIIIATGSKPASLPGIVPDKKRIITSTEALSLSEVPASLVVIGGGIVGCEMASVYARLGSQVTMVEYADTLVPGMDTDAAAELKKALTELGISIHVKHRAIGASVDGEKVRVTVQQPDGSSKLFEADYCLVAVGRRPFTEGLHLEKAAVKTNEKGFIVVNENLQTTASHIYAIGDVIGGAMLAHKAEEEGIFVAEVLAGQKPHLNYRLIPGVVYTHPEVAWVGFTEQQLQQQGKAYRKGLFPYRANGRARAAGNTAGFVKVLADEKTDEVLGVHIVNARAADLIAEAVVAMEFRASAEDVARCCHAHPTYSEALKEACLIATANRPIHL
ncbi:MAG: dihydrolipoyl dehydrogenase [Chitinophagales bacterium]|nr:dihydrolipoyl dehydrogenase [Chitinophagales bacterium]MDW8427028.1 dihydrolipoyl dehydrogenase [Chitinophagales bacterium]